ncbi:MAG: hypothetical protein ACI8R4_001595 [Paracoccaceae bacterium]|jgi:hypothetical protein
MAELKVEGEALKKLVKLGKKMPLSFAFCPGKQNDHMVVIDRRKKPGVIGKAAKSESGATKVAYGTFVMNAKTMELTCEKVVPAMAKVLKKYLKSQKVLVNVLIMDAEGNVLESDEEDLPNDPSWDVDEPAEAEDEEDQQPAAAVQSNHSAADLAAQIKAVQPAIAAAPADAGAKLTKVIKLAVSQIKSDDLDAADRTITALEGAAAKLGQAAPAEAPPEQAAAAAPDVRALAARATALKGVIADINGPAAEKLTAALGNAVKQIKAGELAAADTLLGRIEDAVNKMAAAPADTAPSPEAAKWATAESRLQAAVDKLTQEGRGDLAAINKFFDFGKTQAAAGNYDKAMAAAARVADLIKQAAAEPAAAAADESAQDAPGNVAAYAKSRLNWVETRGGLRKDIEGLKAAIDKATAGIAGLEQVPAKSGGLLDYLSGIDTNLEDTLEQLASAPGADQRESLKSTARKIIGDYRGVLDSDFFKAVDNNGFVNTSIRASALASLQQVNAALET